MSQTEYTTTLPPADGTPGCTLTWPEDCQAATDKGIVFAERWLDERQSG